MNEKYCRFAGKISANEHYKCNESVQFFSCSIRSGPGAGAHERRRVIALREFFVRLARRCLVVGTELRLVAYSFF